MKFCLVASAYLNKIPVAQLKIQEKTANFPAEQCFAKLIHLILHSDFKGFSANYEGHFEKYKQCKRVH